MRIRISTLEMFLANVFDTLCVPPRHGHIVWLLLDPFTDAILSITRNCDAYILLTLLCRRPWERLGAIRIDVLRLARPRVPYAICLIVHVNRWKMIDDVLWIMPPLWLDSGEVLTRPCTAILCNSCPLLFSISRDAPWTELMKYNSY
ncbi:hypothetical protein BDZ97DRAFT_543597 [Flammula alnicola]|nr:hypothetical protein BDZ97DRAFT_543597 [Flammula alnicola]